MRGWVLLLLAIGALESRAQSRHVELYCHRTANKDVPENTLESLEQAAFAGCDVIEIDVRRTMDGVLILNHDGFTERLTDGIGEVETSLFDDLTTRDAGGWMGERWRGLHIVRFDEALLFARSHHLRLMVDVKVKGTGRDIVAAVDRASMRDLVHFGGEVDDIRDLAPKETGPVEVWLQPGVTAERIAALHQQGKRVVVNFSDSAHEMDLVAMRAAVSNGADAINVDYVRLGADAVGRPFEESVAALLNAASVGETSSRVSAVIALAHIRDIPLTDRFVHWLLDADPHVSRAAAVALVNLRPTSSLHVFDAALHSSNVHAQANAAWAVGMLRGPVSVLTPLLQSKDVTVLEEALMALSRMPGEVQAQQLLTLLHHSDSMVCGAAAVALASHHPMLAQRVLPARLRLEIKDSLTRYDAWTLRGKPKLSAVEIEVITDHYRAQMKMLQAIGMLKGAPSLYALEEQAFHPGADFTATLSQVAGFRMWDRIAQHPDDAIRQLGSSDAGVADRAEWMLTMADGNVGPAIRHALQRSNVTVRRRAIRIVAFRGDQEAVTELRRMQEPEAAWAIQKIQQLHAEYRRHGEHSR